MTIDTVALSLTTLPPIVAVVEGGGTSVSVEQSVTHVSVTGTGAAAVVIETPEIALVVDEAPVSVAIEGQETLVLTLPAQQGVAGPPGQGGGETALRTDFTDARYWFVEYASRIKRLDQSVSPAAVGFSTGAWADRYTLDYA